MAATAADALVRVYSSTLVSASALSRSLRLTQCVHLSTSPPAAVAARSSRLSYHSHFALPFAGAFTLTGYECGNDALARFRAPSLQRCLVVLIRPFPSRRITWNGVWLVVCASAVK
ncbi:hypothetical protein NDU88_000795 [Pleurodeles waltl]|uniref:Uncharacterized protein n=1 Tax=Pleurodeles waltl TaxID=8319 RepID=A0AAV7R6S1_PLEWA|nr:hypothetical protein NDU88_000795 [Pleurodeles waltl]